MKKISILAMSAAAVLSCAPKGDPQLGKDSLDKVVAAMTLEEKAHLVIGTGMAGSSGEAAIWVPAPPARPIPSLVSAFRQ